MKCSAKKKSMFNVDMNQLGLVEQHLNNNGTKQYK